MERRTRIARKPAVEAVGALPRLPAVTATPASPQQAFAGVGAFPGELLGSGVLALQRTVGNRAAAAIVQRKGKKKPAEAEPEPDVEPEAPATKSAAELRIEYEAKVAAFEEGVAEFKESFSSLTTLKLVGDARKAVAKVRTTEEEIREIAAAIEARKGETAAALDVEDDGSEFDQDAYEAQVEEDTAFETLLRETMIAEAKLDNEVTELEGEVDLAKEALESAGAASAELTRLRGLWASPALAKGHFTKHKGDTGYATELVYLSRAEALVKSSASATLVTKIRGDGDRLFFDKTKGEFGILSTAGKIRTLFHPGDGVSYYNRQS